MKEMNKHSQSISFVCPLGHAAKQNFNISNGFHTANIVGAIDTFTTSAFATSHNASFSTRRAD